MSVNECWNGNQTPPSPPWHGRGTSYYDFDSPDEVSILGQGPKVQHLERISLTYFAVSLSSLLFFKTAGFILWRNTPTATPRPSSATLPAVSPLVSVLLLMQCCYFQRGRTEPSDGDLDFLWTVLSFNFGGKRQALCSLVGFGVGVGAAFQFLSSPNNPTLLCRCCVSWQAALFRWPKWNLELVIPSADLLWHLWGGSASSLLYYISCNTGIVIY